MSKEQDILMKDHEYDGIQEYDNPLPRWWLITFYATIIFAVWYYYHYEFGSGASLQQELEVAMTEIQGLKQAAPQGEMLTEESLTQQMQDPNMLNLGMTAYNEKCAACHGQELQGMIGPNLTDKFWIHGKGTRVEIVNLIKVGVPDKGMPAWESIMKKEEIIATAAYIHSKIGSNPANAKPPQGNPVE